MLRDTKSLNSKLYFAYIRKRWTFFLRYGILYRCRTYMAYISILQIELNNCIQ